jgi:hypothetical protein
MKFSRVQVYMATFDLVVNGVVKVENDPCEEQLLVASNFQEAYEMALGMKKDLRLTAVHKDLVVRDISVVHIDVYVEKKESEK